ncbi:pseudouridine synthase [Saccharibacillus deserti]|uniref:pseudouridine synthase n=1 Tax=Saccharibacillus deserti TaxID=1634444 RepID=UPI0015557FB9|nr:pseudouridine synthase [Saccharibacillus deserti]
MRINKYVSETGFCSRRETNRLLAAGRISINGQPCGGADHVQPGDKVTIDGRAIPQKAEAVYLALNKPRGIVCTHAEGVAGNIADFMDFPVRIFPVGRLDKDSEGLILLTNDGSIVNRMMRAENGHEKEYAVTVDKPVTEDFLQRMRQGVAIMDTVTLPCQAYAIGECSFGIRLTQGLNRQIRRMCKELGYRVTQLRRERIMNVRLDGLETGQWRNLGTEELNKLFEALQDGEDRQEEAGKNDEITDEGTACDV